MVQIKGFGYSRDNFRELQRLAIEHIGLVLNEHKYTMLYNRLSKRLQELQLESFDEYIQLLKTQPGKELTAFINCITTNLTSFFRENHHFIFLQHVEIPRLLSASPSFCKIRVWSAGCSTGEEPYSIAIAAYEALSSLESSQYSFKILATDIDSDVLARASQGVYPLSSVENFSEERLKLAFFKGTGANSDTVKIKPQIKRDVEFKRQNLLESWNFLDNFNVIFCRNVLIYFNHEKKLEIINKFADNLSSDGLLILGHAESLHGLTDRFERVDNTIYRKIK